MDLTTLTSQELRSLLPKVEREIKIREASDFDAARQKILAVAKEAGIDLKALVKEFKSPSSGKKAHPVRWRHPSDSAKTWSGLGRKPGWVNEWTTAGGAMADLAVTA